MESFLSPANTLDDESTLQGDVTFNDNNNNNEIRYVVTPTSTEEDQYIYPNGDVYEGSFIYTSDGFILKQGRGRLKTPTRICVGNFRNDAIVGHGTLEMFDKKDGPLLFEGYFHECGKRSGLLRYKDGSEFHGDFYNDFDKMIGLFALTDEKKEMERINSMIGTFEGNLGVNVTITYDDESIYIGSTKGFQRHGKGIFKGFNGSYKGFFENNELYYGKHLDVNQNIFEGYFVKLPEEIGVKWEYDGYGSFYYNDDTVYCGEFRNGKKHGEGTLYKKNRIFECQYDEDKRISCCYLREGCYPNEVQRSLNDDDLH